MKKVGVLLIFFLIIAAFIAVWRGNGNNKSIHSFINPTSAISTAALIPTSLSIPKIGVNASVESVGLDKNENMDVPKKNEDVAWYQLGYKPGDQGSAVIAGHFDTVTGAPAVFYNLSNLSPGDIIEVSDDTGKKLTFEVTDKASYPYDQLPMETVFASHDKPRLNLITCDGVYNQSAHNYSKRTVVYTELKQT